MLKFTTKMALVISLTCLLLCNVAFAEEILTLYGGSEENQALFTGDYPTPALFTGTGVSTTTVPYYGPITPKAAWNVSTVDNSGNSGVYIQLAFDKSNTPHVTYVRSPSSDSLKNDLIYATRTGSLWSTKVINSSGNVLPPVSLALDGNGLPHIVYGYLLDGSTAVYGLMYTCQKSDGTWVTIRLPTGDNTGGDASLAIDRNGYPSIAYINAAKNYTLHYMFLNSSGWQDELVDATTGISRPVLRLDASDRPHIAYNHHTALYTSEKWYATQMSATSSWKLNKVDEGYLSWFTGLALSSSGNPALSYTRDTNPTTSELYYSPMTYTGDFEPRLVTKGHFSGYTSLFYDGTQKPHIAYFLLDNTGLDVALNHAYKDMTGWHTETVIDTKGDDALGGVCDLHSDLLGGLHVVFALAPGTSGSSSFIVKYASRDGISNMKKSTPLIGPKSQYTPVNPVVTPTVTPTVTHTPGPKITPYKPPVTVHTPRVG